MKRQIVDVNDTFIGTKSRAELNLSQDIYRVSALWLTNSHGQVLLAQRSFDNKNGAGEWGPAVAGTVEEGETYESNIYKEAQEEIGLIGVTLSLGPKQRVYGNRNYFCQWFRASINKPAIDFTLQKTEVTAVKWVDEAGLLADVEAHPSRYVPSMNLAVKLLISKTS